MKQRVGVLRLAFSGLTEHLNHRNGWVVFHISEPNITYNLLAGPNLKELMRPKPRLTMMEEINSDYDPMEEKYWLEGEECLTVSFINPVM